MWTAALLTLALGSPSKPQPPLFEVARADLVTSEDGAEIIAHDSNDTPIGVIAMYRDADGDMRRVHEFDDGYSELEFDPDTGLVSGTRSPGMSDDLIGHRPGVIVDKVTADQVQEGWLLCAAAVGGAITLCSFSGPWIIVSCPAGVVGVICTCAPALGYKVDVCEL